MKIKASEASGAVLDWMVLEALGSNSGPLITYVGNGRKWIATEGGFTVNYTEDWAQGGPIIERERINLRASGAGDWVASTHDVQHPDRVIQYGPAPLIAAMRCYVASKLGDPVEVPEELL